MGDDSHLLFPERSTKLLSLAVGTGMMNVFVYSRTLTEANAVAWGYVVGGSFMTGCILSLRCIPEVSAYSGCWRRFISGWSHLGTYGQTLLRILVIVAVGVVPGVVLLRRYPVTNVRFYSYYLGLTIGVTIPAFVVLVRRLIIRRRIPAV